jgi:hypothetical protein
LYVSNNPIRFIDPTGRQLIDVGPTLAQDILTRFGFECGSIAILYGAPSAGKPVSKGLACPFVEPLAVQFIKAKLKTYWLPPGPYSSFLLCQRPANPVCCVSLQVGLLAMVRAKLIIKAPGCDMTFRIAAQLGGFLLGGKCCPPGTTCAKPVRIQHTTNVDAGEITIDWADVLKK